MEFLPLAFCELSGDRIYEGLLADFTFLALPFSVYGLRCEVSGPGFMDSWAGFSRDRIYDGPSANFVVLTNPKLSDPNSKTQCPNSDPGAPNPTLQTPNRKPQTLRTEP